MGLAEPSDEPVIHMGDLLDVSCESELDRMRKVFQLVKQPHVILPANHDGLGRGSASFNYTSFDNLFSGKTSRLATRAAGAAAAPLGTALEPPPAVGPRSHKRGFIISYLKLPGRMPAFRGSTAVPNAPRYRPRRPILATIPIPKASFQAHREPNILSGRDFARSVHGPEAAPAGGAGCARRVTVIALDTNQVTALIGHARHREGASARAHFGNVLDDQIDAVSPWVEEARRAGDFGGLRRPPQLGPA